MNKETGLDKFTKIVFLICLGLTLGICVANCVYNNLKHPVEEIIKIDSIKKVNDSIKINVKQLDSIKNAKIIEVESLDNDSTLKLFYELIRK